MTFNDLQNALDKLWELKSSGEISSEEWWKRSSVLHQVYADEHIHKNDIIDVPFREISRKELSM